MISCGNSFGVSVGNVTRDYGRYPVPTWKFGLTAVQPYSVS